MSPQQRFELFLKFWPDSDLTLKSTRETSYTNFLDYIGQQLQGLQIYHAEFATHDFEGIAELIQVFRDHRTKSRAEAMDVLKSSFLNVEDIAIGRSAELALRLWLSMNVQFSMSHHDNGSN